MGRLLDWTQDFVAAYHGRPALVGECRGWRCTIALRCPDSGEAVSVQVEDGRVVAVAEGGEGTLRVTADAAVLEAVLLRRRSPNEPYLFGELLVQGAEADFLQLDYVATTLCEARHG
jgi:hypothetical protein